MKTFTFSDSGRQLILRNYDVPLDPFEVSSWAIEEDKKAATRMQADCPASLKSNRNGIYLETRFENKPGVEGIALELGYTRSR